MRNRERVLGGKKIQSYERRSKTQQVGFSDLRLEKVIERERERRTRESEKSTYRSTQEDDEEEESERNINV